MLALLLGLKSVQLVRAAAGAVGNTPEASAVVTPAQAAPIQPVAKDALPAPMFAPQPVAPPPEPDGVPATISDSERNLLLELRQRRQDLDTREASLAARESMMVAAEQRLGARVAELQALQKTLEALDAARKQREDASWLGLVKVYEAMKPRDAATIFNDLDMPVLLQVVDRMKEAKVAPILAAMMPDKARDVTTQLAQMRTRRDSPGSTTGG
jgi:flagellar motility protein MotE (MotC chaperone)